MKKKILIGLNGYCLDSIKSAKKKGFLTIVDRACPHQYSKTTYI